MIVGISVVVCVLIMILLGLYASQKVKNTGGYVLVGRVLLLLLGSLCGNTGKYFP